MEAFIAFSVTGLVLGMILLGIEAWHAWRQRRWLRRYWASAERRSSALRALSRHHRPPCICGQDDDPCCEESA